MPRSVLIRRLIVVAIAAGGGLLFLNYAAPLQWPTVAAYAGLVMVLCGLLGVIHPPRWLGVSTRGDALYAAFGGAILFGIGMLWPVSSFATRTPASRLDAFLPSYDFGEKHELVVHAAPEHVMRALNEITMDDIAIWHTLSRIRNVAMGSLRTRPGSGARVKVIQMMQSGRAAFFPLDTQPYELVFGMAGRPWENAGARVAPDGFVGWKEPGNVKIAFNFAVEDLGAGFSRLVTETRIQATDADARRTMARYWRLIYPGSGLIRRSMLNAVRDRAERPD